MSTYGFGPAVQRWGGFLSDSVLVPYADHMLVAVPDALTSTAVASASDNISDAWRAVGPQLAAEPGSPVLIVHAERSPQFETHETLALKTSIPCRGRPAGNAQC
jgi:alcohol dehydrogenase